MRVPAGLGCAPFEVGWATGQGGPAQRQTKRHPGDGAPHPGTLEATWWCRVAGHQPQERQAASALRPAHVLANWTCVFSGEDGSHLLQVPRHVLATSLSRCHRFRPPAPAQTPKPPCCPETTSRIANTPLTGTQVSGCWPGGRNSNPGQKQGLCTELSPLCPDATAHW